MADQQGQEDTLILVDMDDHAIGEGGKLAVHQLGILHRAFSVFLFDGDRLLIQKRAAWKYHSAGLWANTCCSHPRRGETLEEAVSRRMAFECGIRDASVREVGSFVYRAGFDNGLTEFEFDHVFAGTFSGTPEPCPEEIEQMRYVQISGLKADMLRYPQRYAVWFFTALNIALRGRE